VQKGQQGFAGFAPVVAVTVVGVRRLRGVRAAGRAAENWQGRCAPTHFSAQGLRASALVMC